MIMASMKFMGEIPFKDVYIHGTVRDATGKKMSKSLGNIIDPIDIINEFGADALRFSIISITAAGQDVFLSKEKFTIGRNFANKIWNASRFVLMNLKDSDARCLMLDARKRQVSSIQHPASSLADRWILSRLNQTIDSVTKSFRNYRFNDAANSIYEFFWHEFCDWYLEMVKPVLVTCHTSLGPEGRRGPEGSEREESHVTSINNERTTQEVLMYVLDTTLRLLHPFMPFITEEIWHKLPHKVESIMTAQWPKAKKKQIDGEAEKKMQLLIAIITSIRTVRSEMNIPSSKRVEVILSLSQKKIAEIIEENTLYITNLAKIESIKIGKHIKKPPFSATIVIKGVEIFIPLKGLIDVGAEKKRLCKEIEYSEGELVRINEKLKNREFLKKAPEAIISKYEDKREEIKETLAKLKENLKRMGEL